VKIRVAILEDQQLLRELLGAALKAPGFEVVVSCGDSDGFERALAAEPVDAQRPIVALIDYVLRDSDGFDLADGVSAMRSVLALRDDVLPVVLSAHDDPALVAQCMESGARGFLRKSMVDAGAVRDCVRAVATGEKVIPPGFVAPPHPRPADPFAELTPREKEVLSLVAGGADNLKIAAILEITERTVKAHVAAIYRKLGAPENRAQLAIFARERGIWPRA
jgi:two-component system, NarL family, nitrate/nitrite response regulator NarL